MARRAVVVGAGHAGIAVAAGLEKAGWGGDVVVLGGEEVAPYQRPPLSKELLAGEEPASLPLRPAPKEADVRLGARVEQLDLAGRAVVLSGGERVDYDELVLATGSTPRRLDVPGADLDGVVTLRTVADALDLRERLAPGCRLVVVGGGVLGLEVAASARQRSVEVVVVEAADRLLGRVASAPVAEHLAELHRSRGVDVRLGAGVDAIAGSDGRVTGVVLADGEELAADVVLIAIGVVPETALAEAAGLDVDDGIVVDDGLRTSDAHVSAIGDCARIRHAVHGPLRLESVPNATDSARTLATRLAGGEASHDAVPWGWSTQAGVRVQSAGVLDGHDEVVVRGTPGAEEGFVVFALRDGRLVAAEAVDRPREHLATRTLLAARAEVDPARLADPATDLAALAKELPA